MNPPATHPIQLRLRELAQLFNSMDPSPFDDRDLDADAEEFIVSSARELSHDRELELILHLETPPAPERAAGVESAVQHYFSVRAQMKQRDFRQLMRRGRTSLMVGLVFLVGCLLLGELIGKMGEGTMARISKEGFTIGGWVAMWRPLEICLYDWGPVRAERRVLDRLARMRVRLELSSPGATDRQPLPN